MRPSPKTPLRCVLKLPPAEENAWPWDIRLSLNPDAELRQTDQIVVTTDSVILDTCPHWTNLAAEISIRDSSSMSLRAS